MTAIEKSPATPLAGLKIVDMSQGAAGPTGAAILSDYGATVTKVEPVGGEWGRTLGPPFWHGTATSSMAMNRGKRSIALDVRTPEGHEIVMRLIDKADVLLESFRPGVMDRLGLSYESLHELYPRLIYCSLTAFGPTGPRRNDPGVDGAAQAASGLMSVTGDSGGGPVKVGLPAGDMCGAMQAAQGILLAVIARQRDGVGQHVEVSLLDALLAFQLVPLTMYLDTQEVPTRQGTGAHYSTPNEAYQTSDGEIMVGAYTPQRWRAFCEEIGLPELVDDPRFSSNPVRMENRALLRKLIEARLVEHDTSTWLNRLKSADVICTAVVDYAQLVADQQLQENEMLVDLQHPLGAIPSVGIPIKLSATPGQTVGAGPLIGEHSRELLLEAGYDAATVDELIQRGIVAGGSEFSATQA